MADRDLLPGRAAHFTAFATLGLVGVTLGVARGALAGFRERLGTKVRVGTFRGVEQQVGAQHRLAESATEVDGAELLAFRDEIGPFGTIVYTGADWADEALGRRSMALMAEQVMPRVNDALKADEAEITARVAARMAAE